MGEGITGKPCCLSMCSTSRRRPPALAPLPPGVTDLAGVASGRLTVIRYHCRGKSGSRWLVRCACGDYEIRKTKAITECVDPDHSCHACDRVKILRKRAAGISTPTSRQGAASRLDDLANQSRGDHA